MEFAKSLIESFKSERQDDQLPFCTSWYGHSFTRQEGENSIYCRTCHATTPLHEKVRNAQCFSWYGHRDELAQDSEGRTLAYCRICGHVVLHKQ